MSVRHVLLDIEEEFVAHRALLRLPLRVRQVHVLLETIHRGEGLATVLADVRRPLLGRQMCEDVLPQRVLGGHHLPAGLAAVLSYGSLVGSPQRCHFRRRGQFDG